MKLRWFRRLGQVLSWTPGKFSGGFEVAGLWGRLMPFWAYTSYFHLPFALVVVHCSGWGFILCLISGIVCLGVCIFVGAFLGVIVVVVLMASVFVVGLLVTVDSKIRVFVIAVGK